MNALITDGQAQIEGNFTQASAKSLATSLKYGALPVSFADFSVETVGPSLAGDQLQAGITAGIIGLLLVMIYCLLYYRGLGIVVVASLLVAGAVDLRDGAAAVQDRGFTLTLPGIAGLIVAVGITADSFIVYFERIRDEMRDGKSMRVAVEAGWIRARATCLAADAVSLLAAIVLYIFAAGVVRGFAFALGLSTLIDLVVFFWFTKPLVSVLAPATFFNSGGKLVRLSAETLGIDDRPRPTRHPRAGGSGLMGKISRLGNDLYNGSTSPSTSSAASGSGTPSRASSCCSRVLGLSVKGLNYGIEFTGGTQYKVTLPSDQVTQDNADALREAVGGLGIRTPPRPSSPPPATARSWSRPRSSPTPRAPRSPRRSSTPSAPPRTTSPRTRSAPAGVTRSRTAPSWAWSSSWCW